MITDVHADVLASVLYITHAHMVGGQHIERKGDDILIKVELRHSQKSNTLTLGVFQI